MPNYLYPVNTMRFGGLASGIDTESMIRDMMRIENMKVDRVKQERQLVEWRRDAYRDITNKLRAFKDEFFDIAKPANYMLSSNTYKNFKTTISGREGVLSASTNSEAIPGIYKVKVEQLAEAAKINGEKKEVNLNKKLSDLGIAGETLILNDDVEIEITEDMTIRQVMNAINSNKEANVKLTYSSITGRFVLQSKDTGSAAQLKINSGAGDEFWEYIGIEANDELITGKDAQISINIGNEKDEEGNLKYHRVESQTNTFTRDGITFNLYDTTDDELTTISITEDIDTSFEKIKNFVDSYNELIDDINTKLSEKQYRDFPPLTEEQKRELSEKDIELWEEKAMSGLLRNDSVLQRMIYGMRSALTANVEGSDIRLSDIGITTGKWFEHGKLYIDEDKLKNALTEQPDKVMELFTKTDGSSYSANADAAERAQRYRNVGMAHRISDILNDNIRLSRDKNNKKGFLLEKAGIAGDATEFKNVMNDQLSELDKRINRMTQMLMRKEENYWRQFTAMEKAIQNMNSQGMWLAQQLNMGM